MSDTPAAVRSFAVTEIVIVPGTSRLEAGWPSSVWRVISMAEVPTTFAVEVRFTKAVVGAVVIGLPLELVPRAPAGRFSSNAEPICAFFTIPPAVGVTCVDIGSWRV